MKSALDNPGLSLEQVAYHEAGHVLTACILGDTVYGASVRRAGAVGGWIRHDIGFADFLELPGRSEAYGHLLRLIVLAAGRAAQSHYDRLHGLTSDLSAACKTDDAMARDAARELLTCLELKSDPFRIVEDCARFELSRIAGNGIDRSITDLMEKLRIESRAFVAANIDAGLVQQAMDAAAKLASEIMLSNWGSVVEIAEALIAWRRLTDGILPFNREKVERRFTDLGGIPAWLKFETGENENGNSNTETH